MLPRSTAPRHRRALVALVLAAAATFTGCSYVVLGDSVGSPGKTTYATYYAGFLRTQADVRASDGATLADFEQRLLHDQDLRNAVAHADVVTLSIGSNDLGLDLIRYELGGCDQACVVTTLQAFEADYERTLTELRALTNARITVLDIYNPEPKLVSPYVIQQLAGVNAAIHRAACAHHILPASVNAAFNGPDGTEDPAAKGYLASDRTHPSDAGARVIAYAVLTAHC